MRHVRGSICFLIVLLSLYPVAGNDVNTGGQQGLLRTFSSSTLGSTGLSVGGSFRLASEMSYIAGPDGSGSLLKSGASLSREMPYLISGDFFAAYGLNSFLDASLDIPIYYDVTGWDKKVSGVGDLAVSLKMSYPFQKEDAVFTQAYYVKMVFPTGSDDRGFFPRHSYYLKDSLGMSAFTGDAFFINPMWILSFDISELISEVQAKIHFNFGGVVAVITSDKPNSALAAAIGVEYTPIPLLTIFTELTGESRTLYYKNAFNIKDVNNDPFRLSPGVRFNIPGGMYAILAADFGLSDDAKSMYVNWNQDGYQYSTKATPAYGFAFSFGWNGLVVQPDPDSDGVTGKDDQCPNEAEDKDGFQDEDGCPDVDNDGDGFIDAKDRCPDSAGTDEGCPVYDTDKDGVQDKDDKCVQEAEDKDGFEDEDGCPDPDNDNDGVIDQKDSCPQKAEDLDGYDDGDGCPDLDNDGDGVSDAEDKCPGVRGLPENNGCPKTKEISRGKLVLSGVTFQPGKAVLTANSFTILDQVYESLVEWKEVKLEIQGHTDNLGRARTNLRLSQMRANSVKDYLVKKGIAPSRLRAVGYGEEFPIADNHSAKGREKNRRVEMRRID